VQPKPVDGSDRARYSAERTAFLTRLGSNEPEALMLFPSLDEYPTLPTFKPLFDRLIVDNEEHVWLRELPPESFGQFDARLEQMTHAAEVWHVFDGRAAWLGPVALPESFELKAVNGNKIFGVMRDALGVESIRVFRLFNR
jgi:hypothetical protein